MSGRRRKKGQKKKRKGVDKKRRGKLNRQKQQQQQFAIVHCAYARLDFFPCFFIGTSAFQNRSRISWGPDERERKSSL